MDMSLILILILSAIAIFAVVLYNRLVALRQKRNNAFADIDVQLKMRADLVPNLVETVKGYAAHERGVFEEVTKARAQAMSAGSVHDRAQAENALGLALSNLMAVAENYPDLKANTQFQNLQSELSDIENKIAAARRFFNNATMEYNTALEQFPGNVVAGMFKFHSAEFFDVGQENRAELEKGVKVSFS